MDVIILFVFLSLSHISERPCSERKLLGVDTDNTGLEITFDLPLPQDLWSQWGTMINSHYTSTNLMCHLLSD